MDDNLNLIIIAISISCLHALEHFGLAVMATELIIKDIFWDGITLQNFKKGGTLFSVPIGIQRIEFNAHRVFSIEYLLTMIKGRYQIDSFPMLMMPEI